MWKTHVTNHFSKSIIHVLQTLNFHVKYVISDLLVSLTVELGLQSWVSFQAVTSSTISVRKCLCSFRRETCRMHTAAWLPLKIFPVLWVSLWSCGILVVRPNCHSAVMLEGLAFSLVLKLATKHLLLLLRSHLVNQALPVYVVEPDVHKNGIEQLLKRQMLVDAGRCFFL